MGRELGEKEDLGEWKRKEGENGTKKKGRGKKEDEGVGKGGTGKVTGRKLGEKED